MNNRERAEVDFYRKVPKLLERIAKALEHQNFINEEKNEIDERCLQISENMEAYARDCMSQRYSLAPVYTEEDYEKAGLIK